MKKLLSKLRSGVGKNKGKFASILGTILTGVIAIPVTIHIENDKAATDHSSNAGR